MRRLDLLYWSHLSEEWEKNVVIYMDIVLLLNLCVSGLLFFLTAQLLGSRRHWRRMVSATVLAAGYGVLPLFFPAAEHPAAKLAASAALVYVAFGARNVRRFALELAAFYIVSFLLGGAVLGYLFFWQDGRAPFGAASGAPVSFWTVLGGVLVGSALLGFFLRPVLARRLRGSLLYPVEVEYEGRRLRATGLLDSGNHLYALGSRIPVILIERGALEPLLDEAARAYLAAVPAANWVEALSSCGARRWKERVCLIPYRGIGVSNILLGFRPDVVRIFVDGQAKETAFAVGIYDAPLSADGSYRILLHAQALAV